MRYMKGVIYMEVTYMLIVSVVTYILVAIGNNSAVVLQFLGMASNYDINVIIEYDNYVLSE